MTTGTQKIIKNNKIEEGDSFRASIVSTGKHLICGIYSDKTDRSL